MRFCHVTWATTGRLPAFPSEALRRAGVRALVRATRGRLLLFAIVDDHVHALLYAPPDAVQHLVRGASLAMAAHASARLGRADIRDAVERSHQQSLVRYLLIQPRKHGLATHPATWSGSAFPDLVGARTVPGWAPPFGEALPRWRVREACAHVGLDAEPVVPADDAALRGLSAATLVSAASAAACVDPALAGRAAPVVTARSCAVELLRTAGFPTSTIAATLGLGRSGARKLGLRPAPRPLVLAARRWITLEARVASLRPGPDRPGPDRPTTHRDDELHPG